MFGNLRAYANPPSSTINYFLCELLNYFLRKNTVKVDKLVPSNFQLNGIMITLEPLQDKQTQQNVCLDQTGHQPKLI